VLRRGDDQKHDCISHDEQQRVNIPQCLPHTSPHSRSIAGPLPDVLSCPFGAINVFARLDEQARRDPR